MDTYILLEEREKQLNKAKEDLDSRVHKHRSSFATILNEPLDQIISNKESVIQSVNAVMDEK